MGNTHGNTSNSMNKSSMRIHGGMSVIDKTALENEESSLAG